MVAPRASLPSTLAPSAAPPRTAAECRTLLGDEATGHTDQEIEAISEHAEAMAYVLITICLDHRGEA